MSHRQLLEPHPNVCRDWSLFLSVMLAPYEPSHPPKAAGASIHGHRDASFFWKALQDLQVKAGCAMQQEQRPLLLEKAMLA